MNANLSAEALAYFLALADDAQHWYGTPLIGANVPQGEAQNGYLTACKKAGLLETCRVGREHWVHFSDAGADLASAHGHKVRF